jgi:hypothetical protein
VKGDDFVPQGDFRLFMERRHFKFDLKCDDGGIKGHCLETHGSCGLYAC